MNIASIKLVQRDEFARMREKITILESQVNIATEFVKEIEKGNWNAGEGLGIGTSSASSALTDSLLSLCNQLKSYSLEEKERNWVTEGLAQFIDILRSKDEDIHELTDNIIRSLVKYMNVNQGALYLINDENPNDVFIEMTACYAYNRKKHFEQRINLGEGLTGQAVLEKETIYMSQIPRDYVKITSGLGEALPNHILIVPLKIEENVFGVVEVASFEKIAKYRIDFVERLGESIASTLSNVKNAQKTHILLKQSQVQTEMMRSQEEEMRQNMEELNATQEEMQRVLKGAQNKEKYLNEIINAPKDSIYILDKSYKVLTYNKMFGTALEQMLGVNDLKGFCMLDIYADPAEKKNQKEYMDRAFAGENFEYTTEYIDKGVASYYSTNFAPLRDEQGKVYAIAGFSKEVTALVMAQKTAEELLNASQQNTEELKSQEEELRQNMEELSATQEEMQRIFNEVQEKERYMVELINASGDAILSVDLDCNIVLFNKYINDTFAAQGMQLKKGMSVFEVIQPDRIEKDKVIYAAAMQGVPNLRREEYFGKIYEISLQPIKDSEGKVTGAVLTTRDITQDVALQQQTEELLQASKQQAEELKTQEQTLNEIINAPKDSIFILDRDYKITSYNKTFGSGLEAMGLTNLKGMRILDLFPDIADRQKQEGIMQRAFAGESVEYTSDFTSPQGIISYHCSNYAPIRDPEGNIYAIAGFAKDVTELMTAQKRTEELLLASQSQTEELKTQEEELRQNMEELSATQEEIHRVLREVQEKERYMTEVINASTDSILTVDRNMIIINCNDAFKNSYSSLSSEIGKGFDINNLFATDEDKKKYAGYYKRVFKGESFKVHEAYTFGDVNAYYTIHYSPIKNEEGKVIAAAVFVNDNTALETAKKDVEKLLQETSHAYKEMAEKERYLNELINVPNDSILTLDKDYKVVSFNNALSKSLEQSGIQMEKGFDVMSLLSEEEQKKEIANYKRAFKGESIEVINKIKLGDQDIWFAINYAPLHDNAGNISQIAVFSKDVTALHKGK